MLQTLSLLFKDSSSIPTVLQQRKMVFVDMKDFLRLLKEKLLPLDVERLRYILADSLTG